MKNYVWSVYSNTSTTTLVKRIGSDTYSSYISAMLTTSHLASTGYTVGPIWEINFCILVLIWVFWVVLQIQMLWYVQCKKFPVLRPPVIATPITGTFHIHIYIYSLPVHGKSLINLQHRRLFVFFFKNSSFIYR